MSRLLNLLLRRSHSLRRTLMLFYAVVVLLVAGAFSALAYLSHQSSLETHASKVLWENSQRIAQTFEDYLGKLDVMLAVAYPEGLPAVAELGEVPARDELVQRLKQATMLFPPPYDRVFYGNQRGQAVGLTQHEDGNTEMFMRLDVETRSSYQLLGGLQGRWQLTDNERLPNDVRTRPWYKVGRESPNLTWTPPYLSFSGQELVVARVRGVADGSGRIGGVLGAEISLKAMDDFTRAQRISEHGLAFVMEANGAMIAANDQESITTGVFRRYAQDYPVYGIRQVYKALAGQSGIASLMPGEARAFGMRLDGAPYQVYVQVLHVGHGLNWLVVTAAPLSDFAGEMNLHLLMLAVGLALVLIGALLLSWRIAAWITRDVSTLSAAVRQLGEGGVNIDFTVERRDEIGQLGDALHQMHAALNNDPLTGLCSRVGLTRNLERAIARQGASFSLLFIDLNGFKAINDTYGHDAGDQALIEVAERLRLAVRQGDLVARLSGDEFVVVLWRVDSDAVAAQVAENIRRALQPRLQRLRPFAGEQPVQVGAALGTALYPRDGEDLESLLRTADQAMYADKSASKAQR
ncbi:sensor domain-containing diguanylate cyclase [Pseudomonas panipatensis]|uniref:Diguanylate cyclase (GGDEF) domain-containing protein n=1 Tax=Pseudomonas panipatensis TaxID=428992 RepID=A0A1G8E421_9PSED|nr:sensor domain-containing diguanylate cyclase [Pseudomonas panipatensis]SDH64692.1 diguanylate cyclase (GGDEF) domain-containing protein [Pseudomonas panipatensis]SMP38612.1 diguanylate cyclase (GGDEF) domain-containing protein [Pseudomonas panipatensis]